MTQLQPSLTRSGTLGGNEDTQLLKLLAVFLMLIDHLGATIFPQEVLFRIIGRMALPLYAWCMIVGSEKTRSMPKYILRVFLLGLISQPLYTMHGWMILNILFTLTLGLLGIYGIQKRWYLSQLWLPVICLVLAAAIKVDYGWKGVLFVFVLYGARKTRSGLIAAFVAYALFWGAVGSMQITGLFGLRFPWGKVPWLNELICPFFRLQSMIWLSLPLIACKTRSGLAMPKWLGYAMYPLHLILLMIIRLCIGNITFATMLGFLSETF